MANAQVAIRNALRLYLNDTPELNRLIRKEESTDAKIDLAIVLAVSDFNLCDPVGHNYNVSNHPSFYLLFIGSLVHILRSAGLLHSRNSIPYSAGGLSVQLYNKAPEYLNFANQFVAEYERKKEDLIKTINIGEALNQSFGVHSEYAFLAFDDTSVGL